MDSFTNCPKCHQQVSTSSYFCPNCGHAIKKRPPSTTIFDLVVLSLKTIVFPPLGIFWGISYLRQSDQKSKIIGLIVIVVTVIETVWVTKMTLDLFATANQIVTQQLNGLI